MYQRVGLRRPEIYGISGSKGHGKDTFAQLVCEASTTFRVAHFAGELKRLVARIFGLTDVQMNDPTLKEVPFDRSIDMDFFVGAMRKETGLDVQPAGKIARSSREVMQFFGTEYVRKAQGDYWVQRLVGSINGRRRVLVPDLRFPNEANALRGVGGLIIRVLRIDAPAAADAHASETEMVEIEPDLVIGVRIGDLSLPTRVAKLIALNKFVLALRWDYRAVLRAIDAYSSGFSAEESARLVGIKHKDPHQLRNVFDYYGVKMRRQGGPISVPHKVVAGVAHKRCSGRCKRWKPLADFNASVKTRDGLASTCRSCASKDNKDRYRRYSKVDSLGALLALYRRTAASRGREFSLSLDDLRSLWERQAGRCRYSGAALMSEPGSPDKVSIDRVDSAKGYTIENIVLCTSRVNLMKRAMTVQEFRSIVDLLHNHVAEWP
jgi:hypothetical protein